MATKDKSPPPEDVPLTIDRVLKLALFGLFSPILIPLAVLGMVAILANRFGLKRIVE
jgi:hypothetical protein